MAAMAAAVFKEHGATRVLECRGDDLLEGRVTDFKGAVEAEAGEAVVFAPVEWPSKEVRDAGNALVMEDEMPFDAGRVRDASRRVKSTTRRDTMAATAKITPHLWYAREAGEAAAFYASIFPDSEVVRVSRLASESPSGPPGSVEIVEFTLFGQPFTAISAGPLDPFNHAISFVVTCEDQAEVDRYWEALLDGGSAEQCGWLRDRFGVSWQVVPAALAEMMADPDPEKARRVGDAMLGMVKLDIAALERAYIGSPEGAEH